MSSSDVFPRGLLRTYRYDPLDRLADRNGPGEACRQFYLDKWLVSELQGRSARTVFQCEHQLLAECITQASGAEFLVLVTDALRSVLRSQGTSAGCQFSYSPHGFSPFQSACDSTVRFSGMQPDSVTGHYLLGNGHRAFNPVLLRFNSPDGLSPFGNGGLNCYAYCAGDPVNRIDADGRAYTPAVLKAAEKFLSYIKRKPGFTKMAPSLTHTEPALVKAARRPDRLIANVDKSPYLLPVPEHQTGEILGIREALPDDMRELRAYHRRYVKSPKQMLSEKRSALRAERRVSAKVPPVPDLSQPMSSEVLLGKMADAIRGTI